MLVVSYRKFFYILSTILIIISVTSLIVWGLNLGIDFKGGSLLEVAYISGTPEKSAVESVMVSFDENQSVRSTGENGFIIRVRALSEEEHQNALSALSFGGKSKLTEKRFDAIGPLLGKEAALKSFAAIALVLIAIILFIWFSFRKVSRPVASWKYGLLVIAGLVHDLIILIGVFVFLGKFAGVEIDTLFVTAALVTLGYSVHDKIVVFDRVRENVRIAGPDAKGGKISFEGLVGGSISQTLIRSINTSLTTLLALAALLALGPSSTFYFSIALIIGVVSGTYSSICFSSPLLVTIEKLQKAV
jgi:preprotein translocase subunit SecF